MYISGRYIQQTSWQQPIVGTLPPISSLSAPLPVTPVGPPRIQSVNPFSASAPNTSGLVAHNLAPVSPARLIGALICTVGLVVFGIPVAAQADEPLDNTPGTHGYLYDGAYLTEEQVEDCAALYRTATEGTISCLGIFTPQQRDVLRNRNVLGAHGAINRAIDKLSMADQSNGAILAAVVKDVLQRQGKPIVFWDADGNVDTLEDCLYLSAADDTALKSQQVTTSHERTQSPTTNPYPSDDEVRVQRRSPATHRSPAMGATTVQTDTSASIKEPSVWPWAIGGGLLLVGIGLGLYFRGRRPPQEPPEPPHAPEPRHLTLPLPAPDIIAAIAAENRPSLTGEITGPFPCTEVMAASPAPIIGEKYTVIRELGRGGMAIVYEVEGPMRERFALKILNKQMLHDGTDREKTDEAERFRREAKALTKLRHPNIVQMIDAGEDVNTEQSYLVMELVEGLPLHKILRDDDGQKALPARRAVHIAQQILMALQAAHTAQIIHRDLKPENIFLTPLDSVKVIDFGIAKEHGTELLTQTGRMLGTPAYMAPEQCDPWSKDAVDGRSDLYVVGIILYEMLTGRHPFSLKPDLRGREKSYALVRAQRYMEPEPLVVAHPDGVAHDALTTLIHRALAKDPRDRPQTANEFLEALDGITRNLQQGEER